MRNLSSERNLFSCFLLTWWSLSFRLKNLWALPQSTVEKKSICQDCGEERRRFCVLAAIDFDLCLFSSEVTFIWTWSFFSPGSNARIFWAIIGGDWRGVFRDFSSEDEGPKSWQLAGLSSPTSPLDVPVRVQVWHHLEVSQWATGCRHQGLSWLISSRNFITYHLSSVCEGFYESTNFTVCYRFMGWSWTQALDFLISCRKVDPGLTPAWFSPLALVMANSRLSLSEFTVLNLIHICEVQFWYWVIIEMNVDYTSDVSWLSWVVKVLSVKLFVLVFTTYPILFAASCIRGSWSSKTWTRSKCSSFANAFRSTYWSSCSPLASLVPGRWTPNSSSSALTR